MKVSEDRIEPPGELVTSCLTHPVSMAVARMAAASARVVDRALVFIVIVSGTLI